MATISPVSRRRRQSLTAQQEQQICAQKQANPKMTQKGLAGWAKATFALPNEPTLPTISAILKRMREREQAEEWERVLKWRRRRRLKEKRCVKLMKLEYAMNRWLVQCAWSKTPVSNAQIEQRVEALCVQLKITDHMRPYHWGMYLAQFSKSNALRQYKYSPEDFADDRTFEFMMETSDGYSPESGEDDSEMSDSEADPSEEGSEPLTNSDPESYGGSEPLTFRHPESNEGSEPSDSEEETNDSDTEDSDRLQEEQTDVKWGWNESAVLRTAPVKNEPRFPAFATSVKSDSGALPSSAIKQEPQISVMRSTLSSTIPTSVKMEEIRFSTMPTSVKMEPPLFAAPSSVNMVEPVFSITNEANSEISRRVDLEDYHQQINNNTSTRYPAARKREADSFVEGFRNNANDALKRSKVDEDVNNNMLMREYLHEVEAFAQVLPSGGASGVAEHSEAASTQPPWPHLCTLRVSIDLPMNKSTALVMMDVIYFEVYMERAYFRVEQSHLIQESRWFIFQPRGPYISTPVNPAMTLKALARWAKDAFALQFEPSVSAIRTTLQRLKGRQIMHRLAGFRKDANRRALQEKRRDKLQKLDHALARCGGALRAVRDHGAHASLHWDLYLAHFTKTIDRETYLAQFANNGTRSRYPRSESGHYGSTMTPVAAQMEAIDEYEPESGEEEVMSSESEPDPSDRGSEPSESEEGTNDEDGEEDVNQEQNESASILAVVSVKEQPRFSYLFSHVRSHSCGALPSVVKQEPRLSAIPIAIKTEPQSSTMPSSEPQKPRFSTNTVSSIMKQEPRFSTMHSSVKTEPRVSIKKELTSETSRCVGGLANSQRQSNNNTLAEYLAARKREADERIERLRNNNKRAKVDDTNKMLLSEYLEGSEEGDDEVNALMRKHIEEAENHFFEDDNTLELKHL